MESSTGWDSDYSDDFEPEESPLPAESSAGSPDEAEGDELAGALPLLLNRVRAFEAGGRGGKREGRAGDGDVASMTYASLLPNVESWASSLEGAGAAAARGFARFAAGDNDEEEASLRVADVVLPHVLDRLAIESLTLSMRNFRAEGGGSRRRAADEEAREEARACAVAAGSLRKMAEVVKRKSDEPMSRERAELLYNPLYLIGELAKSQRAVAAPFLTQAAAAGRVPREEGRSDRHAPGGIEA